MAGRLIGAWNPALDSAGVSISGAKLYTYIAGTTTPKATYTTVALATPQANPVVADSAGRFPELWAADGATFDLKWTDAAGTQITLFQSVQSLGSTATGAVTRDFGADGRFNLESRGGTTYLEGGDASPDNIGGKVRIGGWNGTQADVITLDAASVVLTGPVAGLAETVFQSGTISAASAGITVSSIPAAYNYLHFRAINLEPVTDGDSLLLNIATGGGLPHGAATDYQYTVQGSKSSAAAAVTGLFSTVAGANSIVLGGAQTNVIFNGALLDIWLSSSGSNIHVRWEFSYRLSATLELFRWTGSGVLQGYAGPVTGIGLIYSSGGSSMKKALWACSGSVLG